MRHNIVDEIMINIRSRFPPLKILQSSKAREQKNPISQITFDKCQCFCVASREIHLK